ncbi:MAG: alpha/beta hydrolase, partial [Isosphaeraceae bacterium]
RSLPKAIYRTAAWAGRLRSERRLNCRYPDVEKAVARLSPRPWLMIHGGKDAYIAPAIVKELFDHAREPKELWIVPGAKHNRCLEVNRQEYASRLNQFLARFAPRVNQASPATAARRERSSKDTELEETTTSLINPSRMAVEELAVAVPR